MAESLGLGKQFAVHASLCVRFRDCVVPEVGKFSTGRIRGTVLDRDLINGGNWPRSVTPAPSSEKEETERAADGESKEVTLCVMALIFLI
jgi:hypothetical protein